MSSGVLHHQTVTHIIQIIQLYETYKIQSMQITKLYFLMSKTF